MSASDNVRVLLDAAKRAGHPLFQPRDGVWNIELRPWLHLEVWGPMVQGADVQADLDALIALLQQARAAMGGPTRRPPSSPMPTPAPPRKRRTRRWP